MAGRYLPTFMGCIKTSRKQHKSPGVSPTAQICNGYVYEKADLNAMLPYLSAYMGHSNFSDTAYYIHLMPENLLASAAVDWKSWTP